MAQPKRRWSKARTGAKRSTWKLENPNINYLFSIVVTTVRTSSMW